MGKLTRDRAMTLGFVGLSFLLAFWQRPGRAMTDTKIDLHVDPVQFLGHVASAWTPTTDLGNVHSAQYSGYLWPMGPFYAVLHSVGVSPWVVQRLWLGLVLAISAWGMLKLFDVWLGRPRGVAHLVAAGFYLLNPYTTVFTARSSSALIGYAALPWLLIVVHHGVRAVRGWRGWEGWLWAAGFALILASSGGGINAAVVGWMLFGPLVLLLYEPALGAVRWRDSGGFLFRVGVLGILASLWWIVPLLVHVHYGIDFLQFTEQPHSIWSTNSVTEALRLMAYWTSYLGYGFHGVTRPLFSDSPTLLFNPLVVGASLLIPALALTGLLWTRRFRYAPFLLLLVVVGVVIEVAGFPEGTPIRNGMEWVYKHFFVLRFMRTTQKAAPLIAMGVAGLLGLAAQLAWARLRELHAGRGRQAALVGAPVALAALIVLSALPLVRGTAIDRQVTWDRIPAAWTDAGKDLDRELPANSRALVLPGQVFAFYRWGGTVDNIMPRLTDRPVAVRYETPYSDYHSADLLTTVDELVQQRREFPGQLLPLLRLMGVRSVISGSDDDLSRSGAIDPVAAARDLSAQGLARTRTYGPRRSIPPARGDLGPSLALPQVRRYDIPAGRGMVHVEPAGPATIVDGSARGLAAMAAFGALPADRPILYAGDLSPGTLRRQAARGAEVVVTDSNRRRQFVPEFTQQNLGPTLAADQPIPKNAALINPFSERGTSAQTVSELRGASYLAAPSEGGTLVFPEHAPIAAFDGDTSTAWVGDRLLGPASRWIEIGFEKPRDVPYVDLQPIRDLHGVETDVEVNGIPAHLGPGVTRVPVNLRNVSSLRVRITRLNRLREPGGSGGFKEITIPGVHLRQLLRPPVVTAGALAGRPLGRVGLTYIFERTTGDQPFQRDRVTGSPLLEDARNRSDAEKQIDRVVFAPAARAYDVGAWVHPADDARDSDIDRLAGHRGGGSFDSSSRFKNQPRFRASSAFDGRPDTAWVGIWIRPQAPHPWVAWRASQPQTVSRLRIAPARLPVRRPTLVRLSWHGGSTDPLRVAADGSVVLPRPARSRSFRLTILESQTAPGATPRQRSLRAVGIGSLSVPGLAPVAIPDRGALHAPCGSVRIRAGGRVAPLRPEGTIEELNAGRPVRAVGCAGPVRMGKDVQEVRSLPGVFSVDLLRLRSPAPAAVGPPTGGGRIVDAGRLGDNTVKGVRVALNGPSWLVLGQSYNEGWRATCEGRSLGPSQPIDAYANGWRVPGHCRQVAFAFAPDEGVRKGYVISAVVCFLLLVFLLVGWRLVSPTGARAPWALLPDAPIARIGPVRAAAVALVLTVPLCLVFGLRTAVAIFPGLTLILWLGLPARVLVAVAAALLGLVVPLLYVIAAPKNENGYNSKYSVELIYAHWVGVAALILLGVAAWRMLAAARGRRGRPEPPPTSDSASDGEPAPEHQLPAGFSISAIKTARAE